jgi:type I restriction enzyme S subunit
VFPFGGFAVSLDTRTGKIVDQFHIHRNQIVKQSGNAVLTDVFLDDKYSGISAVLYSSVDVANYPRSFGADFILVHNPLAGITIRRGSFPFGAEYWKDGDELKWTKRNENTT